MTKFYAQRKDVFDIDKLTVVGSPTITSDGIVSGFSKDSYLTLDTSFNLGLQPWNVDLEVTTGDSIGAYGVLNFNSFSSNVLGLVLSANTNSFSLRGDKQIDSSLKVEPNSKYSISFGFDGTKRFLIVNGIKNTTTSDSTIDVTKIFIGEYLGQYYWSVPNSSINLPATKIYVDGELVYSPTKPTYLLERRKEGFDLSKFTVVGSPTITDDGVASGFSDVNYIQIPMTNLAQYNTWEIICKFKINVIDKTKLVFIFASSATAPVITQTIVQDKSVLGMALGNSTASGWQVAESTAHGSTVIQPNVVYWSKIKFTGTSYDLMLSTDGVNYNLEYSFSSTEKITYNSNYNFNIGTARNPSTSATNGDIMLADFIIIGDGKEVFTGAKEKFYAMRGGK